MSDDGEIIIEKDKGGRPTKYRAEFAEQARQLCQHGFTDQELATFFKVDVATLYRWKIKHPNFCEAIKTGGAPSDERVERSLYQRAIGYEVDAVKIMQHQGEEIIVPYRQHIPGEVGAAIFWLKNRRRKSWKDKSDLGLTDDEGKTIVPVLNVITTRRT